MNIIKRIVGIHLSVVFLYILTFWIIKPGVLYRSLNLLLIYVAFCVVLSFTNYWKYLSNKETNKEKLIFGHAHLLSAFVVAIVGAPTCTLIVISDMH